jgi:hypothetical protein
MRKSCVYVSRLYPLSTYWVNYLTSQVIVMPGLCTASKRFGVSYAQLFGGYLKVLGAYLSPLSTGPITTTNLYKGLIA